MLKILCLILISTVIVSASNLWELRRRQYDILRRIAKPPSIKEIQAKHELMRLRLIRGDRTPTKKKTFAKYPKQK